MVPCQPLPEMAISHPAVAQRSPPEVASASKVFGAPQLAPERQGGKVYRVGVFEDVTTLNFWQANGPDNTVWNSYMLPKRLSLYTLGAGTFTLVSWGGVRVRPAL